MSVEVLSFLFEIVRAYQAAVSGLAGKKGKRCHRYQWHSAKNINGEDNSRLPCALAGAIACAVSAGSDDIFTALRGAAMGAANVIPGVSGGTIAFITGIYERLINAIKSCNMTAIRLIFGLKFRKFAEYTDLRFLFAIATGALLSIVSLAKFLEYLFANYPILIWAFFFGLIVASVWGVGKMVRAWSGGPAGALLIGMVAAIGVLLLPHAAGNTNPLYLFICGGAAISSMIIPGVSGSFVLLIMGNYMLVLGAVGDLDTGILMPFAAGCVVGLIALSHLLSWVFRRYHDIAVGLITGFIIGSLVLIWPWKETIYKQDGDGAYIVRNEKRELLPRPGELQSVKDSLVNGEELVSAGYENWSLPAPGKKESWLAMLLAVIGAGVVFGIERIGAKRNKGDDESTA
jgi:putative membrane protein